MRERADIMGLPAIDAYFDSKLHKPFYAVVGDKAYRQEVSSLSGKGFDIIRLSDCFCDNDKLPDMDVLREKLRTVDVNCESNKVFLIGLGEYLSLMGQNYAFSLLDELKDFNLGSAQVVFLLRGMHSVINQIKRSDIRFDNRRCLLAEDTDFDVSILISSKNMAMFDASGMKTLIRKFEDGESGEIKINSDLRFEESMISTRIIESPYDGIVRKIPTFEIPIGLGNDEQWANLLKELNDYNFDLDKYFEEKNYGTWPLANIYEKLVRDDYSSWTYFIFLVLKYKDQKNSYLKYVARNSKSPKEFLKNILYIIIRVPHTSGDYTIFYDQRKDLIKKYPESEIAQFIVENRKYPEESIYKLTDNTEVEREEIVANVSQRGVIKELKDIYPLLSLYMSDYSFPGETFASRMSGYFNQYRKQKVANRIDEDFLKLVDEFARTREFNRLSKRDELVAKLDDGKSFLCWIDALGAEYTGYIVGLAKNKGLAVTVNVGRAELPTITSENKQFFDNWSEGNKIKIEDLDDTKHNDKGGFNWTDNKLPIHLAKELSILSKVVDQAATVLGLRKYDRYVLAGDHGASRLAVIREKEEKYECDNKGEHSGRCCESFDYSDLPFATEENGYIVLADYGRFKGSRKANVEVHGGATLEEVCVPVIELKLKDNELVIELIDDVILADHKTGCEVNFFVNKNITEAFILEIKGQKYKADKLDSNHFKVLLPDIRKAGTYSANIFLNEDLNSTIELQIVGKSGSINTDFDDIFA